MTGPGRRGAAPGRHPAAADLFLAAAIVIPVFLTACGNPPASTDPAPGPSIVQATVPPRTPIPSPTPRRPAVNAPEEPAILPTAVPPTAVPPTEVPPTPAPSPTPVHTLSPTAALPTPTVDLARQIARGKRLVERNSCLQCHTIDGQANFAPTLAGLFGTLRELEGGGTTMADEDYLRESIKDPDEKIVSGFATGAMPKVFFSDAELSALVEYVKSLQ